MRNFPGRVHTVSKEATAEVIEQPVVDNGIQRVAQHAGGLLVAIARCQQPFEHRCLGEFRRIAEAAMTPVAAGVQLAQQHLFRLASSLVRRRALGRNHFQRLVQAPVLGSERVALFQPGVVDALQQFAEADQAMARGRRKVGAGDERRQVGRVQEYRQRPAASAAAENLVGELIDSIEIRPFLAIDFNIDEPVVHLRGDLLVLEALVRHYVTPVTGRIADRQQDGPVGRSRGFQRLGTPRVPVDRVFGMLFQVWTECARESIRHGFENTSPEASTLPAIPFPEQRIPVRQHGIDVARTRPFQILPSSVKEQAGRLTVGRGSIPDK